MAALDGSRSLFLGIAPTVLDLNEAGMGGNLPVKECLNLAVVAGGVEALCGIWANRKSFLLVPRSRTAIVKIPRSDQPPLDGKLRQSTSDSPCWQQPRIEFINLQTLYECG